MTPQPRTQVARDLPEGSIVNARTNPPFVEIGYNLTKEDAAGLDIDYAADNIETLQGCAKRIHEVINAIPQGNTSTLQATISLTKFTPNVAVSFAHEGARDEHKTSKSTGYMLGRLESLANSRPKHCSTALDMTTPHSDTIYFKSLGDLVVALNSEIKGQENKIALPRGYVPAI